MINGKLTLLTTPQQLERMVLVALKDEINKFLKDRAKTIQLDIRRIVSNAITSSPEYQSLLGGQLQSELGVPNAENKIYRIVAQWVSGIRVVVKPVRMFNNKLVGGLAIDVLKSDYGDVLSLPEANYTTQNGVVIPWLEWLLYEGDKIIIRDYHVEYRPQNRSRTNLGNVMVTGGKWRVPPQFSGTATNNFVTRSLESARNDIEKAIERGLS